MGALVSWFASGVCSLLLDTADAWRVSTALLKKDNNRFLEKLFVRVYVSVQMEEDTVDMDVSAGRSTTNITTFTLTQRA